MEACRARTRWAREVHHRARCAPSGSTCFDIRWGRHTSRAEAFFHSPAPPPRACAGTSSCQTISQRRTRSPRRSPPPPRRRRSSSQTRALSSRRLPWSPWRRWRPCTRCACSRGACLCTLPCRAECQIGRRLFECHGSVERKGKHLKCWWRLRCVMIPGSFMR